MKRIILICVLLVLTIATWSSAGVIGPARIRFVEGDILFRTPDTDEWLPASINTPLDEGDSIWCPDGSRAEIQLPDGSVVRLDSGSQLDLLANEDGFTHLHLANGRLYARTAKNSAKDSLQIDADDTTVLPDARTRLRLDMLPNSQEDVSIFKGSAYVEGGGSRTRVRAGDHIALEEGHSELLPLNEPDSWENWNIGRDRIQSLSIKAESFLPDEIRGHSAELDSNGTWVRVPEYGMVWRPTVILSANWAPYRSGRWIWRNNDYVWISYESWGWVPYHFGRWTIVAGFGWCWLPPSRGDVYWGPGYVGWYRTGNHVAWTPLAPGETFYGYGHYGRHSVNITNTTHSSVSIEYRNRHVRGGLTVLPQTAFLKGGAAPRQPSSNVTASISVSIGSPRIKPLRETRMPIVKQTPPRIVPPRIDYKDSRELRQRFQRATPQPDPLKRYQHPTAVQAPGAPAAPLAEKRAVHPTMPPHQTPTAQGAPPHQGEPHQRAITTPAAAPQQQATHPKGHTPGTEPSKREIKQKKVWRVKTPADGKEKIIKEKEQNGREHKNR